MPKRLFQDGHTPWNKGLVLNPYLTEDRNRYYRAWRAERRARGLCIQCARISLNFTRCRRCRTKALDNESRATRRKRRATVVLPTLCPEMGSSGAMDPA